MAVITIAEAFPGATQDANTITLPKSALGADGITSVSLDQLVFAIVDGSKTALADTSFTTNLDQSATVAFQSRSGIANYRGENSEERHVYSISFYAPEPPSTLDISAL